MHHLSKLALLALALGSISGCHNTSRTTNPSSAPRLERNERIAPSLQAMPWPFQLDNGKLGHLVGEIGRATRLCGAQIDELLCESSRTQKQINHMILATGISGAVTAAATGSMQLVKNETHRQSATLIAGVTGGLITGVLAAISASQKAEEKGRIANERLGRIDQAASSFREGWLKALENADTDCTEKDPGYAGYSLISVQADTRGLYWYRGKRLKGFAGARCLATEQEQRRLHRELGAIVSTLQSVCGESTYVIAGKCERKEEDPQALAEDRAQTQEQLDSDLPDNPQSYIPVPSPNTTDSTDSTDSKTPDEPQPIDTAE